MDRHLTVSGFVVHEGRVALHWHRKVGMWLPAGGHIEPGEDPVEAVLREIREEFALEAEPLKLAPRVRYEGGPEQVEPPFTILVEPIAADHVHIDMIYFCRILSGLPGRSYDAENPFVWFDAEALAAGRALLRGAEAPLEPDVQALGLEAIKLEAVLSTRSGGAR